VHNSLTPQAAGSETVGFPWPPNHPKEFEEYGQLWERLEGFGAWGNVCCLFSELAPWKKKIVKVFLVAWSAKIGTVFNLFQQSFVSTPQIFLDTGLKLIT
jgi:hypothetical protein